VLLVSAAAILLCTGVLVGYAVRVVRHGRQVDARLGASPGSPLLPGWLVEAFYWSFHAPARVLARRGVEPDTITFLSLVVSVASLPAIVAGRFVLAAALVCVGAILDVFDGMVARATRRTSAAGAVLDSFVDRVADAAPLVGLSIHYREQAFTLAVPLAALVASSLLSYARAKADEHRLELPNGLMRRHERVVYLVVSLVLGAILPGGAWSGGVDHPATLAGVGVIAVVALGAAIVLVARTRAALCARSESERTAPVRGGHARTTPS
jgi:CDP-diacylglycerol--glycerol-3-phosphate 3-phosphatidyltransferase